MAICEIGRETIQREDDRWVPTIHPDRAPHDGFCKPAVMATVEHLHNDSEPCVACAWQTNPATYRVAGDVFVCADHLATGVNIAIAYLAAKSGDRP